MKLSAPRVLVPVVTGLCSWLRARPRGTCPIPLQVRYDDPEVRTFKLNAERQNGRAAMMGITGCLIHELLGVDALYPTGGLGGAAPPPIIAALAVGGRSGSAQMFSEGDIGVSFSVFLKHTKNSQSVPEM